MQLDLDFKNLDVVLNKLKQNLKELYQKEVQINAKTHMKDFLLWYFDFEIPSFNLDSENVSLNPEGLKIIKNFFLIFFSSNK